MFFYQTNINIVDGKKTYGDLPENYTVAYENESTQTAYFPMVSRLDEKYVEVTEIDKVEYDQALSDINNLVREKRKVEFEETKAKILEKQKVIDDLNKTVVLLESEKETLKLENEMLMMSMMEISTITAQQEELNKTNEQAIMELSMLVTMGGM